MYNQQQQQQQQQYMQNGQPFDIGGKVGEPISTQPPHIRSDFVRKVYSILCVQLAITTVIGMYIHKQADEGGKQWIRSHFYLYYLAMAMTMGTLCGMACCCQEAARTFPANYIFLSIITVGIGITTGFAASMYTAASVMQAMAATCVVFFGLTAFACLTKSDFTGMGPYLAAALFSLIGFSLVMYLFSMITGEPINGGIRTLYGLAGTVIFSLYIVYDTQLIVGGTHKQNQFSVDDYVFAALNLYLDIINLFLFLLSLMGDRSD